MKQLKGRIEHVNRSIFAAALFLLFIYCWPANAQVKLPTVMSLDYCADQYVLSLADRNQIIALSAAAEDLYSYHRERARGLPKSRSSIAEVVTAGPDIAVQTYSAAARMGEITEKAGVKLLSTTYGRDVDTMFTNVSLIANAIGQNEKAAALIQEYKVRLEQILNSPRSNLTIAYVTPSGFTAGADTFVDDIIGLSGFNTYASTRNYHGWLELPLEDMIIDPPDIIITSFFDSNMNSQSRWSLSRHNYLLKMMEDKPTIHLPGALMACDGLFLIEAAEQIRAKAAELGVIE